MFCYGTNTRNDAAGTETYKIKIEVMDQGIFMICRKQLYLIAVTMLNKMPTVKIHNIYKSNDEVNQFIPSVKFMSDNATLEIICNIWSDAIFIGRFNLFN